jgi:predicted membrane-bound dolichyl-phosphate-mannose-protein mannosyltransferase
VKEVDSGIRRYTMPKQFENPEAKKLDDEIVSVESAQKKIENVAEKAAEKPAKTEQKFDKDHKIFSI